MNYFTPNSHTFIGKTTTERRMKQTELMDNPFFMAVVQTYIIKLVPDNFPNQADLLTAKYDVRLRTYALNELLGRPVPSVISILGLTETEEREIGYARLDKILGFVDDEGNEVELIPIEQQQKMNDIMIKILKTQGLDFDAYIEEAAYLKTVMIKQRRKINRQEKKQKISKMKLKNQRKLGAVSKIVKTKSASEEAENEEKGPSAPIKIKTAKDFEHYRKSKRPIRI